MTTLVPYRPELHTGRDGFAQLLRAEWTKFRTVRGWVIGMFAGALLIVGLGVLTGANSECGIQLGPNCMPHSLFAPVSAPSPTMSSIAMAMPMSQPRTVRNFVHSARSNWAKPSRPARSSDRYGASEVMA